MNFKVSFSNRYIFWPKVIHRLSIEKNRLWRILPVRRIAHRGFRKIPDKKYLIKQIEKLIGKFGHYLFDETAAEVKEHILKCADEVLCHCFDMLGSGPKYMEPIDWHLDFKSGFSWLKGSFYRNYITTDLSNNADVKVPWELSRCHHLLWLGEAFLLTKDEKYSKEIICQIQNWIKENPLMYSINWTCSMDVAIRAVNWMFAINMIAESENLTDKFIRQLYYSLYEHGFFIFNNLEKSIPYSANHYAANLVGLLYLGQIFKHTKKGEKWWHFALNEYYSEIRMQILPSGIHYEKSISYHRLMTELFSYPAYMLQRVGEQMPIDVTCRIQSMYDYIANYVKPNGEVPLIGDNDDGRFLPFVRYNFLKHDYFVNSLSFDNRIISAGVGLLYNISNYVKKSILYDDAGFAILRNNDIYLFFNNSDQSKYQTDKVKIGTHTHNDQLSYDLAIGRDDIIIDPGSYVYTSDITKRNEFRSTKKHNTIIVDNEEQNILSTDNAFGIIKNSIVEKIYLEESSHFVKCEGAYTTIKEKLEHCRKIEIRQKKLVIDDILEKDGDGHNLSYFLHFAAGIEPELQDGKLVIVTRNYNIQIVFECSQNHEIFLQNNEVSPSYGILEDSKSLELKLGFDNLATIKTIITWEIMKPIRVDDTLPNNFQE